MGVILSKVTRKLNRFNVENRAHRILDKEKPTPAPKYESNLRDMERSLDVDPEFSTRESMKNLALDDRLKNVYVTSKDSFIDYGIKNKELEKPLPESRGIIEDFEYGYKEPHRITPGRCSLRQAMKFITDNQGDPSAWTTQRISDDYKMKPELVDKILRNFKSFQICIPDKNKRENILTQPKANLLDSEKKNE